MEGQNRRVRVVWACRKGHQHEMCHPVHRGLPPELRCPDEDPPGYGGGGGGGCTLPANFSALVEYELGNNFQESKRRGYVLIES